MSMNKYMHPRNIYKTPPNFKELALQFPEFFEYLVQDLTGKVSLDFKNAKSLRALTCILLKKDFSLNVEIPLNKLIPTVPLRLNYLLWIQDLLSLFKKVDNIKGIDIGTGASCVYSLIAAKSFNWSMIATEIDAENIAYANNNINRNCLSHKIKLVEIKNDSLIKDVVENILFDFCMCNPPFFSSSQELHPFFKSRNSKRPHPKNAFCSSLGEVVSDGGEVLFITKLIDESIELKTNVSIYSTMVGHKSSLPKLKEKIRESGALSFEVGEFCQGNTTRWGLAWTFHSVDLRKVRNIVHVPKKEKLHKPLKYTIPNSKSLSSYTLESVRRTLINLFKELDMICEEMQMEENASRYFVSAFTNTWSHQRKKRRDQLKLEHLVATHMDTSDNSNREDSDKNMKRLLEETFVSPSLKKLKLSEETSSSEKVLLKFSCSVINENSDIVLELNCASEFNREHLHQILQYIKNKLKS